MGEQMHAAVLYGLGQVPRYEPFARPAAAEGAAVVTVTAAALKLSDRLMAAGTHYAPARFPAVAGLDGVGRLADGRRVAFFAPVPPYGAMAEQALVRDGVWFRVPDGADDVTAAAVLNPGGAAWKVLMAEGGLAPGQRVLILGATGTSGRIAAQLAVRHGARVVVAGRNQTVLDDLVARGAGTAINVASPRAELAAAIAASGPYDLIVDYLWGAPAEAVFEALQRGARPDAPPTRYLLVGMTAGDSARLPALTLRRAPVQLIGSGFGGPASLADAATAFAHILGLVSSGEITLETEAVPLAEVTKAWDAPDHGRRIVFVP
jgi:NADPH:quinone reductase-like Zn-dependent oxidoreductase